jgi:hypothetical protein
VSCVLITYEVKNLYGKIVGPLLAIEIEGNPSSNVQT